MLQQVPFPGPPPSLPGSDKPEYSYNLAAEEVHLKDFWAILVKRRRVVFVSFLLVLAIGFYFTVTATRLYTAVATLKIEPQNPSVTGLTEMFQSSIAGSGAYDYYQTQFALLESRSLAARVISELKLDSNPQFRNSHVTSADAIGRVRSMITSYVGKTAEYLASLVSGSSNRNHSRKPETTTSSNVQAQVPPGLINQYLRLANIKPVPRTRLVEVVFSTPDPTLAKNLANAHAATFIRMNLDNRYSLTTDAREFLGKKLSELKIKVEHAEDNLNRFRKAHGVISMEKGENIIVDQLIEINKQLTRAKTVRIEAESLQSIVASRKHQDLAEVMKQGLVPQFRANVANLEGEKTRVSMIVKPDHPRIQDLTQQIAEARRALNTEIANAVRVIESNYAAARAQEEALEAEARRQQQKALNLKELSVEYSVLSEDVSVNRALYENVLKRLHESQVSNDLAVSNIQVVQEAERPLSPSSPNLALNIMLAMAFGLFLGVGSAFAFEYMDSTVNTPDKVWRAVTLGTLGVVPDLKLLSPRQYALNQLVRPLLQRVTRLRLSPPASDGKELIISRNTRSIVAESYRTIRTALLFSQAEKPPQVILLTSPSPGEGKTVTTLNLAIALAQNGHRTLIVDADLRQGCCHHRLGIINHRGLSNVITGQLSLDEVIHATSVEGLSLLSRGTCPPNPSDLLGSSKMREILRTLRDSYQYILIDSPPAIAVTDAAVISVLCEGVILVLHSRTTTVAVARRAMAQLNAVRAPVLGVILNGIDLRNPNYTYYRTYYGSNYSSAADLNNGSASPSEAAIDKEVTAFKTYFDASQPGPVSQDVFARICDTLTEAVGPMAPQIFRDQMALLGESSEAFPKGRLNELLERLCEEIISEPMRRQFLKSMKDELRPSPESKI